MEDRPPNYYQGILQLRNTTQEVIDFVEDLCSRDKNGRVSKVEKVKNGFDFYMMSNKFLKSLGYKLKERFRGELQITSKLHTRDHQTSKNLYRLTVLFRQYDLKKKDTIEIKGEYYEVIGIKDKILLRNKKNFQKLNIGFDKLRKLRAKKNGELL